MPMEPSEACFLGIGQGSMQATPLQMVNVASTVINGGTLWRPQIVREVRDPHGTIVKSFPPVSIREVPVTQNALAAVRAGMARVTGPGGTAAGLGIDGLPYSGKTGTAETAGGNGPNTTWFIAWAPSHRPKLAIAVFVDRSGGYGASGCSAHRARHFRTLLQKERLDRYDSSERSLLRRSLRAPGCRSK